MKWNILGAFLYAIVFSLYFIVRPIVIAAVILGVSVAITYFIEKPIIFSAEVTDNKRLILGVNAFTNICFNIVLAGIAYFTPYVGNSGLIVLWYAIAELLLIPFFEASVYRKVSDIRFRNIVIVCYFTNLASCAAGLVLNWLLIHIPELKG